MKYILCEECNKEKPINETFIFENKKYCKECLSKKEKNGFISEDKIIQLIDDTVCCKCGFDNGKIELQNISNLYFCENCCNSIINRPFPKWIKISVIVLIIIVLFGFFYNSKYLFAYFNIRESIKYMHEGKIEDAYKKIDFASKNLPHLQYLKELSNFYEGIYALDIDDSKKALSLFESYKKFNPNDKDINFWILRAKSGIYYDSKDYQNFYLNQKELYKLNPEDVINIIGVASGASCLFIITKDKKYIDEMNQYFDLARKLMLPEDKDMINEYIQRIKYRVYSEKIISTDEYYKKFPEGWKGDIK